MKKKKEKIFFVPIDELMPNPFQPRGNIDEDALAALASSIEQLGILQPICVTPRCKLPILSINSKKIESPSYNIIAGERRWRAARIAGLKSVPCIILDCVESDMAYMAFAENIFREDLTFFDIAVSLNDMLFMSGITQTDLAKKLAISQSAIANKLRLLKLTPDERTIILKNNLTERHARSL
ncbi:MAG: ParB/RepB/Spo0J family partition protein, partial [Clostridia bacterium]